MDQSRYWMQKEQTCLNSHVLSMFGDSWEEQAFAEDAAGPLGGCIWPPRSYTCSFCRREFRSAQALGGHMNVHRRDRARLKKISSSSSSSSSKNQDQVLENLEVVEPNICVLQNPNPNFDLDHIHPLYSSSSSRPSNVSILRPFTCSFAQEPRIHTPLLTCSKIVPQKRFQIPDLRNQDKGITKVLDLGSTTLKKNSEQSEVLLASDDSNTLVRTRIFDNKDDAYEGLIGKKRRRESDVESFFPKDSSKHSKTSTLEGLDLELRLGDRP